MTLTDWIDGSIKPTVEGVYERQYTYEDQFCAFFIGQWRVGYDTADKAWEGRAYRSLNQHLPWRGLKEKP